MNKRAALHIVFLPLMGILGHADHQSTMRYSHLANDTLRAAVEAGAAKMNLVLA